MSKTIKSLFRINILVGVAIILLLSGSANAATSIWDEASRSPLPFTWNHTNFDDFNVSAVGTENLTIIQTNLGTGTGKTRTIRSREDTAGAGLIYTTTRYFEEYEVSKNKNLNVEYALNNMGNIAPYGKYYAKVNLFAEPYVGINGKANKLAKLVLEMGKEEKMTLTVGQTWEMGGGYTLTAQSIDARSTPRLAWFVLSKDGAKLDDKVIEAGVPTGTGTQGVYTYYANIGGESNVPIFVTYIDSVFSGATSDMVQLKYTWLIDTKITEVKSGDTYGLLQMVPTSSDEVKFENNYYINLASNSTINLAGNIKFNVIDNATHLKFSPTVGPRLNITASPESIPVGIATNVIFTVTSNGLPISAATVSLSGAAVGNGVTQTNGKMSISINAADNGTIIVEAEKSGYAKGTTTIQAYSLPIAGIASWDLQDNYVLKLIAIDVRTAPRQAWLQLSKNGILIEDSMVTEGSKFSYCPSTCTFNTTVDLIFSGTQGDLIRFTNTSQNSEINGSPLTINATYLMKTANFSGISWALTEGYDLKLIDFDSRANPRRIWLELLKNSTVKEDIFLEEGETFNYTNNSKIIEGKVDAIFSGTQGYLVKLINVSQFSESGSAILPNNETHLYKSTTFSGISWSLNGSYNLKMMDIDAKTTPHRVWFEFSKNNTILDDSIVYSNSYYNYSSSSVMLNSKIDAIFSNLYSGVVILKEVDLSENGTVIVNNSSNSFISGAINRSDYALAEGYNLSLLGVEATSSPRQAWIRIYKDNNQKDEKIVTYMDKYVYYNSSGNIVLYAEVDSIFSGASQDMVQFRNVTQFSGLDGSRLINGISIIIETNYSQSPTPTPTPTPSPTTPPGPTPIPVPGGNINCEIRGTVFQDTASVPAWDASNFAGFFYNINTNISTELLNFIQPLGAYIGNRSISKNQLEYSTTKALVQFKANEAQGVEIMNVSGAGVTAYQVVGWQAEKWIAVNGKANKIARLALEMSAEDKKTLTTGENWSIGAGYEITINAIDARTTPRQLWFTLKKNGTIIDEIVGQAPQSGWIADKNKAVYSKTKNILGENSLLFTVYVDSIFSGATSDMVQFKYAWLVDESSAIEIKNGDPFGVFEVRSADTDYIKLTNVDPVNLSINSETTLMGNMKFRIADNSSVLRFYPFVEHTIPGVYEIRGRVAQDTTLTPSWDAQTFAGFYYDIDDDVGSERLTLTSPVNNRNIPYKSIVYSTSPQEVSFTYSPFGKYQVIGFMAEKYFAGYKNTTLTNPTSNVNEISAVGQGQLHKVLIDDDIKRTIAVGGTYALQEGYVLKATDIDLNARTMLLSLLKDGNEVDSTPLSANQIYVYRKRVGSVSDLPIIMVRFDTVFSGSEFQAAFLKGMFQISDNPTSVRVSDRFGNMEVTSVSSNNITMSNKGSLVLTKNTEQLLMGNLKFKIADNDNLSFYPKITYIISDVTQPPYYPYISINLGKIYTNSRSVALTLSATRAFNMSFKNESYGWTPWETFEDTKSWTLSNGDGLKTVYFKARNNVGESSIISDSTILDTVKPVVNIEGLVNNTTLRFNENIVKGEVLDSNLESATLIVKNETLAIVSQYNLLVSNNKFLERVEFAPNQNNTLELNAKDKAGNSNITSIKVIVKNNFNQTTYNVTTSDPVNIDAKNETDTEIKFISKINKTNVTVTITAITNETQIKSLNGSAFALSKEMAVGKIVEVNMSGLNASNESEVGSVIITMYYNKADLDLNGDGIIGPNDLDENYFFIYWLNTTNGTTNWTKLLKNNPTWVNDSGRTKISGNTQGNVWVKVKHLSTFGLAAGFVPKPTDSVSNYNPGSGGGGGGGGGGGASGENYTNIEVVEKYDMQISKDALTSYRFTHAKNPIMFVNITGNTSLGMITASIEVLKNNSTIVKTAAEGLVYKNANIWVGTSGYATPKNIKQALIKFRVDNEWMSANGVSGSDIALVKWDGSTWIKLETSEISKDDTYNYFEAKTQAFSPFAIIGLKGKKSAPVYAAVVTETPVKQTSTPTTVPTKGMPGFEIVTAITAIYMLSRRRK